MKKSYKELLEAEIKSFLSPATGRPDASRTVKRDCDACGLPFEKQRELFVKRGFRFVLCPKCGLIFANPFLKPKGIERLYASAPSLDFWAKSMLDPERRKLDRALYENLFKLLPKRNSRKILEISMRGGLLAEAPFCGDAAVEFFDFAGPTRRMGQRLHPDRLFFNGFPAGRRAYYDVVVSMEAMEHFYSPSDFLKAARERLQRGGFLAGVVSNAASLVARILQKDAPLFDGVFQKTFFHAQSLKYLLARNGFRLLRTNTAVGGGTMIEGHLNQMTPRDRLPVKNVVPGTLWKSHGYKLLFVAKKY